MDGKVAIITGASGTLGEAVARTFFREGASLALVHFHHEVSDEFASLPEIVLSLSFDLANPASAAEMVQEVLGRFGRIDILANLAGGFSMGTPVHEASPETWQSMFSMNAGTVINACGAVIPVMRKQRHGKIVNIGAEAALRGKAMMAPYIVSKSAVIRITESLAEENRSFGINVNCVLPGIIDSRQNRSQMPDADRTLWASPEAIADVIAFLSSDASRALHGAAVPVSGPCDAF
ncbi:MAG: SDR family NAD(P)-dependent oxidoreductase [Chlorobiaceae bacterium]|nr:SDR family NAD(P)-dependent oxidoreductase [Chlorobiaceae bacterium]NTW10706.1 SDR family NAD(P)-dependent oxidoreductase [Chlorobiaceae bacterium]